MSRWYGGALLLDEFEIRVDGGFILEDCASIKIQVRVYDSDMRFDWSYLVQRGPHFYWRSKNSHTSYLYSFLIPCKSIDSCTYNANFISKLTSWRTNL